MSTKQISLITRWNAKVADSGTKLLALSCFDHNRFVRGRNALEDDFSSFQSLHLELTVEVIDLLHEFCYFLRKLIERTNIVDLAKTFYPHEGKTSAIINTGSPEEETVQICQENLWWILGRVIHSKSVMVLGGDHRNIIVYHDGKVRDYDDGRYYVEVSSDHDKKGGSHVFDIPLLVSAYTFSNVGSAIQNAARQCKI